MYTFYKYVINIYITQTKYFPMVIGGFPSKMTCIAELWCFAIVNLNKLLNTQLSGLWFELP